jgi:hypothetical protein
VSCGCRIFVRPTHGILIFQRLRVLGFCAGTSGWCLGTSCISCGRRGTWSLRPSLASSLRSFTRRGENFTSAILVELCRIVDRPCLVVFVLGEVPCQIMRQPMKNFLDMQVNRLMLWKCLCLKFLYHYVACFVALCFWWTTSVLSPSVFI